MYYNLELGSFDGSNSHAVGLLGALKRSLGDEYVLIAGGEGRREYRHSVSRLKRRVGRRIALLRRLRRHHLSHRQLAGIVRLARKRNFHPDVILARSVPYDATPLLLAKEFGCRLVVEHNSPFFIECTRLNHSDPQRPIHDFEGHLLRAADGIYVVSEVLKRVMQQEYRIPAEKLIVIPNAFRQDLFDVTTAEREEARRGVRSRYLDSGERWVVIFVGSLRGWHGIDRLLKVAEILSNDPSIEIWIAGDGEERELVRQYVAEHSNVRWLGNLSQEALRDVLFASDMGVMPYEPVEPFYFSPLKMFDMIGARLPFIGLDAGQIGEFCRDYLGPEFLIESSEPEGLAERIETMKRDGRLFAIMRESVTSAWEGHSWDDRAQSLLAWLS